MTTRAKAFPYPVLSTFSNDYIGEASVDLDAAARILDGYLQRVAIDYTIAIGSRWMDEFILDGHADVLLDVYCRSTLHRESHRLSTLSGHLEFDEGTLVGSVELSVLVVAREEIEDFRPEGINPEFGAETFSVSKGDMIGIGPTVTIDLDFTRTLLQDLITIALAPEMDPDTYAFQFGSERITVRTGSTANRAIQRMRGNRGLKPHLYMSVYKDCIAAALLYLIDQGGAEHDVPWGRRLVVAAEELGIDPFGDESREHADSTAQRMVAQWGVRKVADTDG